MEMGKYRVLIAFNFSFNSGTRARLEVGDEVLMDVTRAAGFVTSGDLVRI
jgi:hypothetical protein